MNVRVLSTDKQLTGMAGEFLTVGKLFKRGYQAAVTFGNAKGIDVLVFNPSTRRSFGVEVKTLRHRNCFQINRENLNETAVYIFVILNDFGGPEEFFIVPGQDIKANIGKFYGSSYKNQDKPSKRPAIKFGALTEYKDKWQVFDS